MTVSLASKSRARQVLLRNAGVQFSIVDSGVHESAIREGLLSEKKAVKDYAPALARAKAHAGSKLQPGSYIIGADQTLIFQNMILEKARTKASAFEQLSKFCGQTHLLHSAVALVQNGQLIWTYDETAALKMRSFDDEFLNDYLDAEDEFILNSVGCYRLEGVGIQLFEWIKGDYFTILGLPLLPLLEKLRELGELNR